MPRSIWNGVVSFGMVSIPVRLYPATSSQDIAFNELHTKCHGRLKRIRWCPIDKYEVPADEVVKGYEYAKGQYVEMSDEDFEDLPIPSKHTVALDTFVKSEEIDPVYYDTSYVLEPEEIGKKPYVLLMHALKKKQMIAVGHITIRKKEQLCVLRAEKGNLMLETLYYADELRVDLGKELPDVKITEAEEKMAESLVELSVGEFDAKEYKDAYREALLKVIEAKLEGKHVVSAPTPEATQVTDLMEALRQSVEAAKRRRAS